jgi:hypothetical protein
MDSFKSSQYVHRYKAVVLWQDWTRGTSYYTQARTQKLPHRMARNPANEALEMCSNITVLSFTGYESLLSGTI